MPLSACLLLLCLCFSLLSATWPWPPCSPHLPSPFPSFPPSLPSLLLCSSAKFGADVSWDLQFAWDLWFAWGLHLSSPMGLRSTVGPSHFPLSCALRSPTQSSPPEAAGFQDIVALCEIQAGPLPSLPNGGASVVCLPHPLQRASARDPQVSWKSLLDRASCLLHFPSLVGLPCLACLS